MSRSFLRISAFLLSGFVLAAASAQAQPAVPNHKHYDRPSSFDQPGAPGMPLAPRLQNLGVHTFPVTTTVARARLFINQGLNLAYAFNHAEAARSFAEAARLDPNAAMAYWGHALVLGPNINAPMTPDDEPKAYELAQKAVALKAKVTPRERAYIDAVAARFTGKAEDRQKADRAYVEAMRKLIAAYPNDLDAQTLYAEALMDLMPWSYWTRDGRPQPGTEHITQSLERVLSANKNHPGALHLWIHLWEATDTPERAEAEADRLVPLMPGAGHIVHMPAHIYQRVGRHADVIRVNQMAALADEDYIAQCKAQGLYPLAYYPHNLHFIWMGATASGQRQIALDAARKLAGQVPHEALATVPILQGFLVVPYWAMVRFEQWDDILADKGPSHDTLFTRATWIYARAMARVAKGELSEAERELEALNKLVNDPEMKKQATFSSNSGFAILRIAPEVVAGEIAAKRRDWNTALLHFERGVRYEDALVYQEPHDWHAPVRQNLGAALVAAGRADEAETVYYEDLKRNAESGWSLAGLFTALKAQNKNDEAALIEARFKKSWRGDAVRATTTTASSKEGVGFSPAAAKPDMHEVHLAKGLRLRYADRGPKNGRAVLMLHGITDSSFSFSRVLPLMPPDVRVIAPDQRGHGDSDHPERGYAVDDFATDALQLLDALKVPRAIVIGHSMGSFVARRMAELAPARIERLILVASAPNMRNDVISGVRQAFEGLQDPIDPGFVREFQLSTVHQPVPGPFMDTVIAESRKAPARVWKAALAGLIAYEPAAPGDTFAPTLILGGDKDAMFARAEQEALARAIPGASLHIVQDIGHTLHWEAPQQFVALLALR